MSEKWWDMSDDELDDLFREASDKVEVPFDSSAYNKLRQKIAEQPMSGSPNGFKKRWLFLLAGLFLTVGVGLVYRFGKDSKKNNQVEIVGNKILSAKTIVADNQTITNKNLGRSSVETTAESSVKTQTTTDGNLDKSSAETQTAGEGNLRKSSAKTIVADGKTVPMENLERFYVGRQTTADNLKRSSVKTQITTEDTQTTAKENLGRSSVETQTTTGTHTATEENSIENNNYNSNNTENQWVTKNTSKIRKDKKGLNYGINPVILGQNSLPIIENLIILQEKFASEETVDKTNFYEVDFLKNKDSKPFLTDIHAELPYYVDSLSSNIKPVKFSKFGIRLVLSPDMNSIENLGKMALGGSVGLLVEYKISKKLVIQSGMVYSSKSYVGSFDDYHNWTDWKNYHPSKPTEVDGGCKVFDVPINLRLNLFQKPKQTWFISSGISSYWMMNESYTYNYAWSSPKTSDWSDNSKYYFSVLNFSVGLERQISKRFSFQVEPYLKTPLKNVGRGGVNLYSSGLLFSTKYSF